MGITFSIPFLLRIPEMLCQTDPGSNWEVCSKSEYCHHKSMYTQKFNDENFENSNTLDNWTTQYDIVCSAKLMISMVGSLHFIGYVLATLTMLR